MPATHKVQPYLQKHHIWGCVENGITHTVISDVPLASLPMQTVRLWVAYSRQTAIRAVYHQGVADFTGLAGFCRWRHEQRAPVLQARWHCLVNPPLLGNPSQGEREGEGKSKRETWRENVQCQGFIRGQPDDSRGCRCVYMKAGTICGANYSQKSGCIQGQCGLVGNLRSALHIQIGYCDANA